MRQFKTEERLNKIKKVLELRRKSLTIVLENIHDAHNVSAIFRTSDAVGVSSVSLLYTIEQFPPIAKSSSASALKWVDKQKYKTVEECYSALRDKGFKIYASALSDNSKDIYSLDLTEKIAVVLGNESRGVSEEAAKHADELIKIPMLGMIQSLNVSVAAGVILFEALRQRMLKGDYDSPELSSSELENKIDEWCDK
jgi:tRNA (guanosine-2'-O-)-methyltransferase